MVAVGRVIEHYELGAVSLDTVERVFNAFLLQGEATHAVEVDVVRCLFVAHERTVVRSRSAIRAPVLSGSETLNSILLFPRLGFLAFCRLVAFNGHKTPDSVNVAVFIAGAVQRIRTYPEFSPCRYVAEVYRLVYRIFARRAAAYYIPYVRLGHDYVAHEFFIRRGYNIGSGVHLFLGRPFGVDECASIVKGCVKCLDSRIVVNVAHEVTLGNAARKDFLVFLVKPTHFRRVDVCLLELLNSGRELVDRCFGIDVAGRETGILVHYFLKLVGGNAHFLYIVILYALRVEASVHLELRYVPRNTRYFGHHEVTVVCYAGVVLMVVGRRSVLNNETDVLVLAVKLYYRRSVRYLGVPAGWESFGKLGYELPLRCTVGAYIIVKRSVVRCIDFNVGWVVVIFRAVAREVFEEERLHRRGERNAEVVVTRAE